MGAKASVAEPEGVIEYMPVSNVEPKRVVKQKEMKFDISYLKQLDNIALTKIASNLSIPELLEFLKVTKGFFKTSPQLWIDSFIVKYGRFKYERFKDLGINPRLLLFSYAIYEYLVKIKAKNKRGEVPRVRLTRRLTRPPQMRIVDDNVDIELTRDNEIIIGGESVGDYYDNYIKELSERYGCISNYEDLTRKWDVYDQITIEICADNIADKLIVQIVSYLLFSGLKSGVLPRESIQGTEVNQKKLLINKCITCKKCPSQLFKEINSDKTFCDKQCQIEFYK